MKIQYVVLDENLTFAELSPYTALLPAYRREKIARYRFEEDKLRSLIAGLLLRHEAGDAPVLFGEHEKPYLADNSLFFSLSHSGSLVVIATDAAEIGVDVEALPSPDKLRIADRFYHPAEREYVRSADDAARAFCRIWTRKEAYLKMTGEGISTDLTAFDTTSLPLSGQLYTVDLDGYCLSVCSENPICEENVYISKIELKSLLK